ncbi:uncharacterized protein LOC129779197 [Toxorhynchites rutilus septentrionalis]|uniref:uncharacterized protein LOC129779197 n=1 Tax=Toxorhynchites rutilus septentrionalis TaxID=329112 RepID=UPI0024789F96|nr:uncharacterized protein LOC129779197 [Toxorhynchites rutilus septentrionalis]
MKTVALIAIVCMLTPAALGDLKLKKCKSGALPTKLVIEGCKNTPCTVVNGRNLRFQAEFINPTPTRTLTASVIPRVGWFNTVVKYKMAEEHRDGCKKLTNTRCPLGAQQLVKAAGEVPVSSPITGVKANIEFQLRSDTGIAVCFKIDAKVVKR